MNSNKLFIAWIVLLVSVGGILYGYDIGVISGALLFIRNEIPITDAQLSLIGSAVLSGGLVGTIVSGPIGDALGRRMLIRLSGLIFVMGIVFILFAKSFAAIFAARFLLGIGVGVVAVAVPLYVSEIVPGEDRGKYVTFFQLLLTFGIVLAYFVDLLFTASGNWRGMFLVLLAPSIILLLGSFLLPETPRWLIGNNKEDKARKVLSKIYYQNIETEVSAIKASLDEVESTWRELLSPSLLLPSLVAICVAIFNQLTGINSFLQYAPLILKQAGISSNVVSMIGTVGIGMLNFLFTILAIGLIDSLGRRPLLLIGTAGVVAAEVFLGIVNTFSPDTTYVGVLSLIGLLFFIIFFAIGPGVVVWLAISELFPTRIRGKGMSLCLFFNSLAAALLAAFFLPLIEHIGINFTYWLFAFFTLLYFLLAFFFLPETKAKSLEEIQHELLNRK